MFGPHLESLHASRLDQLLWQGDVTGAERLLERVNAGQAHLAKARIALQKKENGVTRSAGQCAQKPEIRSRFGL